MSMTAATTLAARFHRFADPGRFLRLADAVLPRPAWPLLLMGLGSRAARMIQGAHRACWRQGCGTESFP